MLIYITKWATTKGILVVEGEVNESFGGRYFSPIEHNTFSTNLFVRDKDAFDSKDAAIADATRRFQEAAKKASATMVTAAKKAKRAAAEGVLVHAVQKYKTAEFMKCKPFKTKT